MPLYKQKNISFMISSLFKQFKFPQAVKILISETARKLFDPYRLGTYSQTGEDIVLGTYLNINERGFYVDVGCNHPFLFSNTLRLYLYGWKGLAIDANNEVIYEFKRCRPKDTAICELVSNKECKLDFHISKDNLISSVSTTFIHSRIKNGINKTIRRNAKTLHSIFQNYNVPKRFELLSIDVEGHDYEVLTSFDIQTYRPKLIICEIHNFNLTNPESNKIYAFLSQNGYEIKSYTVMNGFFIDKEA